MNQADASLEAARLMYREGQLHYCVDRIYYAVFYAASAVLASRGSTYGKHTAVRAALHRDFVQTGLISSELGKLYNQLFLDRTDADYLAFTRFDQDEVGLQLLRVDTFLETFRGLLESGR